MKVAVFLAEGFEEIEAISVIDVLRRGGADVDTISISEHLDVEGGHHIIVQADYLFSDVAFDDFDLLVLPGGMPGTTNLGNHKELSKLLTQFSDKGKKLAAICAAPSILGELNLLKGKEATCYPGYEKQLIGCKVMDKNVVVSDNIVTGKGAGVAIDFALELLSLYMDDAFVESLRTKMIALK